MSTTALTASSYKKKKKKTEHGTGLEQCDPDAVPAGSRIQTSPPSWSWLASPPLQPSCSSSLSSCSSILSSNPACHRLPRLYLPFFLDCTRLPPPPPLFTCGSVVTVMATVVTVIVLQLGQPVPRGGKQGIPNETLLLFPKGSLSVRHTHTQERADAARIRTSDTHSFVKEQIRTHTGKCANKQAHTVCATRNIIPGTSCR